MCGVLLGRVKPAIQGNRQRRNEWRLRLKNNHIKKRNHWDDKGEESQISNTQPNIAKINSSRKEKQK